MKTIIENLQALVDSVEFAETEYKANYVIETQDKKLLTEALNEALRIHSVMQAEGSDVNLDHAHGYQPTDTVDISNPPKQSEQGAAVGQRSVGQNGRVCLCCFENKPDGNYDFCQQCLEWMR